MMILGGLKITPVFFFWVDWCSLFVVDCFCLSGCFA